LIEVIRSFRGRDAQAIYEGKPASRFASLREVIERKLQMLDAAGSINDLRSPPGNRLEALSGDRKGQHSIRINRQFRICFRWTETGPEDVEIADYH
jgi:toxin HigB-1